MAQLTKEQMAAIDNYGSEIKTLKDFVTAVRKRPGMYIGHIGQKGVINMHREIYSNSIDQILAQDSPANWFSYYYNESTTEVRIEDNGKSLPFEHIIRIFTANHTSKNFEKKLYDYSSGVHGSGSKIVNALSTKYIVEAYHYDGTAVRMEFEKGYPITDAPIKIPNKEKKQGLMTYFIPDPEIMGYDIHIPWKIMYRKIKDVLSLTPIGSICEFTAVDTNGKVFKETIVNKDGIVTDLIMKVSNPINKPIVISNDDGTHKLDIAFCYDAGGDQGPNDSESITAFANFSPCAPTVDSTHVSGSLEAICRWFTIYMNNIYLSNQKNKDKLKVNSSDIRTGLNICISGAHLDPILTGQSKEFLSNEDMVGFCKDTVMKGLDEWSKANPQDLQKLCKFFKDIAEVRAKQEAGKVKIATKYQKNPITNLPKKYKGHTFALIAEDMSKESAERPNDPISKRGLEASLGKLASLQEEQRMKKGKIGTQQMMACGGRKFAGTKNTFSRYAPIFGSAIGAVQSVFQKPDYTNSDLILDAVNNLSKNKVSPTLLNEYLNYNPIDRNYYLNQLKAQSGATRRALMNSGINPGQRIAGLLAADYNAQQGIADTLLKSDMYNEQLNQNRAQFNRGTSQYNSGALMQAAAHNAQLAQARDNMRLSGISTAANMRELADTALANSRSASLTNFFDNLGALGRENRDTNMLQEMIDSDLFGTLSESMKGGWRKNGGMLTKRCRKRRK